MAKVDAGERIDKTQDPPANERGEIGVGAVQETQKKKREMVRGVERVERNGPIFFSLRVMVRRIETRFEPFDGCCGSVFEKRMCSLGDREASVSDAVGKNMGLMGERLEKRNLGHQGGL